jgi:CO/xanthine dehydrogenase Mo-binding subunit
MVFSFTLNSRDISVDAPPEAPLLLVSTRILIKTNLADLAAVAMEVEINDRNGRIHVVCAVAADDSGHIVNPDGIRNHVQGGEIQSLS